MYISLLLCLVPFLNYLSINTMISKVMRLPSCLTLAFTSNFTNINLLNAVRIWIKPTKLYEKLKMY